MWNITYTGDHESMFEIFSPCDLFFIFFFWYFGFSADYEGCTDHWVGILSTGVSHSWKTLYLFEYHIKNILKNGFKFSTNEKYCSERCSRTRSCVFHCQKKPKIILELSPFIAYFDNLVLPVNHRCLPIIKSEQTIRIDRSDIQYQSSILDKSSVSKDTLIDHIFSKDITMNLHLGPIDHSIEISSIVCFQISIFCFLRITNY